MSGTNRTLAVITARGGSKGLPGKNIRTVHGLPLIAWSIAAARSARHIDRLILSSDDPEIIAVARRYGCDVPFVRPPLLASDEALSTDVMAHAITALSGDFDYAVLLQPTSPLRTAADIDAAIALLDESGAPAVVSVCSSVVSPLWMFTMDQRGTLAPYLATGIRPTRRQDHSALFVPNGAVYVVRTARFLADRHFIPDGVRALVMPARRSIDIDTQDDIDLLEWLTSRNPELIPNPELISNMEQKNP